MVKNKVFINSVFSVIILLTMLSAGGCKSVREFGNGVYYNEGNSDIKITVTECDKLWNEVNEKFLNNLDVKKQLCEKPCSFYYVREDGENTASLYTEIDGTDSLSPETSVPFIIDIDENGALIINYSEDNVDIFV